MITGEPGIGKTRSAAEVARAGASDGNLILFGRRNEDPLSPFEGFRGAFRHVVDPPEAAALFAVDERPQLRASDRTAPTLPLLPTTGKLERSGRCGRPTPGCGRRSDRARAIVRGFDWIHR